MTKIQDNAGFPRTESGVRQFQLSLHLNTAHVEGKCIGNGLNLGFGPKSFAAVDQFS